MSRQFGLLGERNLGTVKTTLGIREGQPRVKPRPHPPDVTAYRFYSKKKGTVHSVYS